MFPLEILISKSRLEVMAYLMLALLQEQKCHNSMVLRLFGGYLMVEWAPESSAALFHHIHFVERIFLRT